MLLGDPFADEDAPRTVSAVVTGAGSGIGREIAELFATEGARIAASTAPDGEDVVAALRAEPEPLFVERRPDAVEVERRDTVAGGRPDRRRSSTPPGCARSATSTRCRQRSGRT